MIGLIILLPLLGAVVNGIFGAIPWKQFPRIPATVSGILASAMMFIAFLVSYTLFFQLSGEVRMLEHLVFPWIDVGGLDIPMHFRFDGLSGLLCLIITGIGFLIHVYSIGYMHDDENPQRYFTYLNLFASSMLILVLGASLPILFIGWEGVGLCSYLLIGFWYQDIEKAKAGKKAFIANRVGDLGFLIGVFLLFMHFGTLDFEELRSAMNGMTVEVGMIGVFTLAGLALFVGATGKSAQIPLFVWLPDAMAGPTPVSALIHAATMVTAGVYMTCRLGFMYELAPLAGNVIAVIGLATAFVAASIALVQNDIKKILAYSTVSQLGYMFLAVGVGAYTTAVFHLMTHAFFKALLFLGSGSVIHAMGGEQDVRKMGGLHKYMPITSVTFGLGTLAIAGIPFFAGFFSKDEILWQAVSSPKGGIIMFVAGLVTAGMTATYMARCYVLTFLGENRSDEKTRSHLHESPYSMTVPLMILAFFATIGGFFGMPHVFHLLPNYLEILLSSVVPANQGHGSISVEVGLMLLSVLVAAGSLAGVYWYYLKADRSKISVNIGKKPTDFLYSSYYLNELYEVLFVRPLHKASIFLWKVVDVIIIDGFVLLWGRSSKLIAGFIRFAQTGVIEDYVAVMLVGLIGFICALYLLIL